MAENILNDQKRFVPFMGITETWLKGYITDAQVQIKNYSSFRSDRVNRHHGGAMVYVHNSYTVSNNESYEDQYSNCIILRIEELNCIVAAVYRPPDCPNSSFRNIIRNIQSYIDLNLDDDAELYLMGDFNLPNIDWTTLIVNSSLGTKGTEAANTLLDFMTDNLLTQVVNHPTRGNNTLDLVFTNRAQYICETSSSETCLSDHNLVSLVLGYDARRNHNYVHQTKETDDFDYFNLNLQKADLEAINEHISEINWNSLHELCQPDPSGEKFAELIRLTTLQVCYLYAPEKQPRRADQKPKISRPRKILYRKKKKLKARLNCLRAANPEAEKLQMLKHEINLLAYEIQQNISREISDREILAVDSIKKNPKYFFSYAKRFSKLKSNIGPLRNKSTGLLQRDAKQMAELLQDQYSSVFSDPDNPNKRNTLDPPCPPPEGLSTIEFGEEDIISAIDEISADSATSDGEIPARIIKACKTSLSPALLILWETSFRDGVIPAVYKEQYITPIFKKGNKTDPGNYRPVSLTSHVIKIFERVIKKNLVKYLEEHQLFSTKQHGFRKGRSCLTQLIQHMDHILNNYLDNSETDVIYLDYAKAFDKVDHAILLKKIKSYGIRGQLYDWIEEFLRGRTQTVVVDGKHSRPAPVISGVPQGTVLGPILFLLYVNDMERFIKNCKISSFADDTRISRKISQMSDTDLLQEDLNRIIRWSEDNNMKLHEDKFELLCYRTPATRKLSEVLPFMGDITSYETPNGTCLEGSALVKDLGVTMSEELSWTPHINTMVKTASQVASWVLGVFKGRSKLLMLQLYKSLIRCRAEYCSPLWSPTKITDIQLIETVQRQFTRRIHGLGDMNYWDRLKELKLKSLQRRRERYSIIHIWKLLHGVCPNDIKMEFKEHPRLGFKVLLPTLNRQSSNAAKTCYDNSFAVRAGRLWNTLPKDVNTKKTLESFKAALEVFLETIPDMPPTPGYSTPNSNSIIDWCNQRGGPQMVRRP